MTRHLLHLLPWLLAAAPEISHAMELEGCWRAQQTEVDFTDGRVRQSSENCVMAFHDGHMKTMCSFKAGNDTHEYDYTAQGSGSIQFQRSASSADKGPTQRATMAYNISDGWLTTIVMPAGAVDNPDKIPSKMVRLFRRVGAADDHGCHPRDITRQDWGKLPITQSTYAFEPPKSFVPYLDFGDHGWNLAQSGSNTFFVGAYATMPAQDFQSGKGGYIVLMLEDARSGPKALTKNEFKALMQNIKATVGKKAVVLEDDKRVYFDLQQVVSPNTKMPNAYGIAAYHNIHGRMLITYVIARDVPLEAAKKETLAVANNFSAGLDTANP